MTRRTRKNYRDAPPEFAELALGPLDELGDATAEFEGNVINVAGGIPGERVVARIHRYRRRRREIVSGHRRQSPGSLPRPRCPQVRILRRLLRLPVAAHSLRSPTRAQEPYHRKPPRPLRLPLRRPRRTHPARPEDLLLPQSRQVHRQKRRTTRLLQPHNPPLRQD